MSEEKFEFKVGDIVDDHGISGEVFRIGASSYPIGVKFTMGRIENYTLNGRLLAEQTRPSLKLVERPVKGESIGLESQVAKLKDFVKGCIEIGWSHTDTFESSRSQNARMLLKELGG